jgi:hypothetical protein
MKNAILLISVFLIIYFVAFDEKNPSCHDLGLRDGIIQFYIHNRNPENYDANNMGISLKNISTLKVDKKTRKRTCVGQIMVFDKQNGNILQMNDIIFSTEWSEQDNKFNDHVYSIK